PFGAGRPGRQQERLGFALVLVADRQHHSGAGHPAVLRRYPDPRVVQQVLELPDPGFLLALVLAGCLVRLVLPEVALLAAVADVLGDDGPVRDQLLQLLLEPVIGALRKPGRFGLAHGLHLSLVGRGSVAPGTGASPGVLFIRNTRCSARLHLGAFRCGPVGSVGLWWSAEGAGEPGIGQGRGAWPGGCVGHERIANRHREPRADAAHPARTSRRALRAAHDAEAADRWENRAGRRSALRLRGRWRSGLRPPAGANSPAVVGGAVLRRGGVAGL